MTTERVTWPGPSTSLDEEFSESWDQCEESTMSHVSLSLLDKKAPRAEPEEDIDDFEAGFEDDTQELAQSLQQTEPSEARVESDELVNLLDASPPPPELCALSVEESLEKEVLSSLEGEVDEVISDAEIVLDPTEDISSPDSQSSQEWTLQLTEPADSGVDPATGEKTGDETTTEESSVQGNSTDELENNTSDTSLATLNDSSKSDDACSPPFADESEEDEEVNEELWSCRQQRSSQGIGGEPLQSHKSLPAVVSAPQQAELLPESLCEHAPMGGNQEAAQQVLGQSSAPLSAVAMEPPGQGGAAFQGSGWAVIARERQDRAGERTVGESKTSGEGRQKESGLGGSKALGPESVTPRSRKTQIREWKTEKYIFKGLRMESDCGDDSQSDSGVSADFSPSSTWENSMNTPQGSPPNETPIEREIRRSIEREQSLRRLRGLPVTTPKYVEIPVRKTVVKPSLPAKLEKGQSKDFAGKKMQQEIHKEAKREEDLVKIGKVPGGYDRGTVPQLKERKELFEAFQKPSDSAATAFRRSRTTSRSSSFDVPPNAESKETATRDLLSPSPKAGGPAPSVPRGPALSEGKDRQVIIVENCLSGPAHKWTQTNPEEQIAAVDPGTPRSSPSQAGGGVAEPKPGKVEEVEEEEEVPKENPFFKLRSSTNLIKVEQDIREAREREKELHQQRMSLYGGRGAAKVGIGVRSASVDSKGPTPSAVSANGPATPDLPVSPSPSPSPSPSKAGAVSPAVSPPARSSHGKLAAWPPAQAEEDKPSRPELARSPHAPRQKTPLVQRWESGLINGCNQDDD